MPNLMNALNRVARHQPQPFVAPVLNNKSDMIFTYQDRIPYHFKVERPVPGWWRLAPTSKITARQEREALPWETATYLEQLPRIYMILLYPVNDNTWMSVPFNASDGKQRGVDMPTLVYLVPQIMGIAPLDIIDARMLDKSLLYCDIPMLSFTYHRESGDLRSALENHIRPDLIRYTLASFRDAYLTCYSRQQDIEREMRQKALKDQQEQIKHDAEQNIRWHLEYSGATLMNWQALDQDKYHVVWADGANTYSMRVDANMRIESAGICLNHTDKDYNLSAIVEVMREARRLGRPGAGGETVWAADDNTFDDD